MLTAQSSARSFILAKIVAEARGEDGSGLQWLERARRKKIRKL
jgi:hypothetical protein